MVQHVGLQSDRRLSMLDGTASAGELGPEQELRRGASALRIHESEA